MGQYLLISMVIGIIAIIYALYLMNKINTIEVKDERMKEIQGYISEGALAFLYREYKILIIFVAVVFILISVFVGLTTGITYLFGGLLSAIAGYLGMKAATSANARTAQAAADHGISKALEVAFSGGAVMGMAVVGLGLFGVSIAFIIYKDTNILTGFALGASSIALFSRVGGGIYTKAADVGADLVGKVEAGIPEDDPRNPAVIADNVGDNVGDVAGMGSDLYESYVAAIISTLALGFSITAAKFPNLAFEDAGYMFPILLAALGIVATIIGSFSVKSNKDIDPHTVLNRATYISGAIVIVGSAILSYLLFASLAPFAAIAAGLIAGIIIGKVTEIFTSENYRFVREIADQAKTGAATTIISGISVGMLSTAIPVIIIALAIAISYTFVGLYGIALAAVGMLSIVGITIAIDSFGPVADNAGGIAEMANCDAKVRQATDKLDSIGNTTAAIGKGFAIASAALSALALFSAYANAAQLQPADMSILEPAVIIGLFIGGMIPFIFVALTMKSVGKAAFDMIHEVRRQFKEDPGIMKGTSKPDYRRCIDISTTAAIKEMILPGILAFASPVAAGFILGTNGLAGMLAGTLVTGIILAIFLANAGGAWDNAKKYIESGANGGKGSDAHKAAVVGDTVGDPFKDTSGPALNTLIKVMAILATLLAGLFGSGII